MSCAIASALAASAFRASSGVISARSSRSGTATLLWHILRRMQRTLWMWAKLVAMLRRFDDCGNARQMCGATRFSSSWLIRSFTRQALSRAADRTTGSRVLRGAVGGAMMGVALGVATREAALAGCFFFFALIAWRRECRLATVGMRMAAASRDGAMTTDHHMVAPGIRAMTNAGRCWLRTGRSDHLRFRHRA